MTGIERGRTPPRPFRFPRRWAISPLGIAILGGVVWAVGVWSLDPAGKETTELRIEDGDTVASLFARAGLPDEELLAVAEAGRGVAFRLPLVAGREVRVTRFGNGRLSELLIGLEGGGAAAFTAGEHGRFTVAERGADAAAPSRPGQPGGAETGGGASFASLLGGGLLAQPAEARVPAASARGAALPRTPALSTAAAGGAGPDLGTAPAAGAAPVPAAVAGTIPAATTGTAPIAGAAPAPAAATETDPVPDAILAMLDLAADPRSDAPADRPAGEAALAPAVVTAMLDPAAASGSGTPADRPAGGTAAPEPPAPAPAPELPLERVEVRSGDSLYLIFQRHDLPQSDLAALLDAGQDGKRLRSLRPGQSFAFRRDPDGGLDRLDYIVDEVTTVRFERGAEGGGEGGGGFRTDTVTREYDRRILTATRSIESSLFADADGLPDKVLAQMVEILGWDIDFSRDQRRGDSYSLLYEELRLDGRPVRAGDIRALEFRSELLGKSIRAFRYAREDGRYEYFDQDGNSMRREFLRSPVEYTRISSRFSKARRHPILRKVRPHTGVDYAAPRGTPIRATGDGRVLLVGRKGGYGKTIVLSHGSRYTTLYAHLSRYAKGMRRGVRVRQGQIIGRVGSTGLSTGPHLHYEFRVNGTHRDPLRVKLPRATPLPKQERADYRKHTAALISWLDALRDTRLASLER